MCMEFKRVLCIGGHSLDAEVMGGPLIIKLAKKGIRCTMAHVTQGRIEKEDATEKEKQDSKDFPEAVPGCGLRSLPARTRKVSTPAGGSHQASA